VPRGYASLNDAPTDIAKPTGDEYFQGFLQNWASCIDAYIKYTINE
jgi:hypothetical protein